MTINNDLILNSFESAAESLGDITPHVYRRFFLQYPEAESLFNIKGAQFQDELKVQMVRDAIYAYLEYLETPEEVEIVFKYTIPQHVDLDIPIRYFIALLEAVADVVCDSVDDQTQADTKASWSELLQEFRQMIDRYAKAEA